MKEYSDPRMHTAEHVLNQTMVRMFGCGRAFSSHIERKKSKCDYRFGRELTAEETAELERRVNEVLRSDLPVTAENVPMGKAAAELDLRRLPPGAGGDGLRVVRVGDYDACPCIGEHVQRTGEIGVFRIASNSFADGVLRLRFRLEQPAA